MQEALNKIIIIAGPTASGKSQLALKIAQKLKKAEIINADSMQLYQNLPILSAQPSITEQELCKHNFYGFLASHEKFSVAAWLNLVLPKIKQLLSNNITPIIVGGTGMYIYNLTNGLRALADIPAAITNSTNNIYNKKGLDYLYAELIKIDLNFSNLIAKNDTQRIIRYYNIFKAHNLTPTEYQALPNNKFFSDDLFLNLTLITHKEELELNIKKRLNFMFENGAINEVKQLTKQIADKNQPITRTIGFKQLRDYLANNISYEEALNSSYLETKKYAKRQITWFKNKINENIANITSTDMLELYNIFLSEYAK